LKIIGEADVIKVAFETNIIIKNTKYSYRLRTISMIAESSLTLVDHFSTLTMQPQAIMGGRKHFI
jgi:hypothetical protein